MSSKKGGLADLKRLAREAREAREAAERETTRKTARDAVRHAARDAAGTAGFSEARRTHPVGGAVRAGSHGEAGAAQADLSADERALFRRLAGPVAPVDTRNRLLHTPSTPAPTRSAKPARQEGPAATPAAGSDQAMPRADAGLSDGDVSHLLREDGTAFLRSGMGEAVLKKLQTRGWRIEADLDLHGMTVDQARARLADFILQCVAYDARCVRIVHGKGYNSPNGQSVLRDRVQAWLVGSQDVRAFVQASERDGGAGATLALLGVDDRRARDRRAPPRDASGGP